MLRNPPATAPPPQQTPIQQFDPSNVPIPHLIALRSKLTQAIDSGTTLFTTVSGENIAGMAAWPDILAKYNNLLIQSHTLMVSLTGQDIPQPARKLGEARRERINPFETLALHPMSQLSTGVLPSTMPGGPPLISTGEGEKKEKMDDNYYHGILENLLRTEPHPSVLKKWDETVRRFVERRKGGAQVEPQDVLREMTAVKEGHDARIERARTVVDELKERWDWRMRVAVDDPLEDEEAMRNLGEVEGHEREVIVIADEDEEMENGVSTSNQDTSTAQGTMDNVDQPPTTQQAEGGDGLFSGSESEDDDDDFEDVMES